MTSVVDINLICCCETELSLLKLQFYSPKFLHNGEFKLIRRGEVIHSASKYTPSFIYDCLNYKERILSAPLGGTQMKSQCKFTLCPIFLHRNLRNQKCRKLMCGKKTEIIPQHVEEAS